MVGATDPGKPMAQMRNRIDTQAAGTVDMDPANRREDQGRQTESARRIRK